MIYTFNRCMYIYLSFPRFVFPSSFLYVALLEIDLHSCVHLFFVFPLYPFPGYIWSYSCLGLFSYLLFMTWNVMYVRIMQFCCKKNVNLINPMFNYRFYLNSFKVINIYDILFLLKIIRIACHLSFLFTHSYTSFSFLFLFFYFSTLPVFILYSLLFYRLRFFSFFSSSLLSHLHSTPFLFLSFSSSLSRLHSLCQ